MFKIINREATMAKLTECSDTQSEGRGFDSHLVVWCRDLDHGVSHGDDDEPNDDEPLIPGVRVTLGDVTTFWTHLGYHCFVLLSMSES